MANGLFYSVIIYRINEKFDSDKYHIISGVIRKSETFAEKEFLCKLFFSAMD